MSGEERTERVAAAIVASLEEQCDFGHVGLISAHVKWGRVAEAAVAALQLREERSTTDYAPHNPVRRLVGPWEEA